MDTKSARSKVASIRRDREIPPLKAIEELTKCIRLLDRTPSRYALAEAHAVRGTAYARGMEDHKSAFRDWRHALKFVAKEREPSSRFLNLAGYIRMQMAFHSKGASRIWHFDQAMRNYRAADNPQGVAFVLVERGITWKEKGEYRKALTDLEEGLAIARWKRMAGRRQLQGFIRDAKKMAGTAGRQSHTFLR